jgi:hypothetical protein
MSISTIAIQKNILRRVGRNPDDTTMQALALHWMNVTLDKTQGFMPDVPFLETSEMDISLVDGQATYAMPTDFFYLSQVRIDSEYRTLNEFSHEEFDRWHPNPSAEDETVPSDWTLEYDRVSGRHIMRVGPIPEKTYVAHAIMRRWHPSISSVQGLQYDKLETAIEEGGIYHGSMIIYADQEYVQYRSELKQNWLETVQGLQQVMMQQKPRAHQIPTMLRGPRTMLRKGAYYY